MCARTHTHRYTHAHTHVLEWVEKNQRAKDTNDRMGVGRRVKILTELRMRK